MNIYDYYKHAKAWKQSQDEAERERERARLADVEGCWKKANALIAEALPIENLRFFETEAGQFSEYPRENCFYTIDALLPGASASKMTEEKRDFAGIIRVHLKVEPSGIFKIIRYTTWVNGKSQSFESPELAFLAAYEEMQKTRNIAKYP